MINKKKDFIELLQDLCYIYRDYVKKNDNSRLNVNVNNNMIKMELFKDNEVIDEFGLVFNQKEKDIYRYISIILMKSLFCSKIVYCRDNIFYSDDIAIKINVLDEDLFNRMFDIMSVCKNIDFYNGFINVNKVRNKINRDRTAKFLDERINITKSLLKVRDEK